MAGISSAANFRLEQQGLPAGEILNLDGIEVHTPCRTLVLSSAIRRTNPMNSLGPA
jgi:hypothetical protein